MNGHMDGKMKRKKGRGGRLFPWVSGWMDGYPSGMLDVQDGKWVVHYWVSGMTAGLGK